MNDFEYKTPSCAYARKRLNAQISNRLGNQNNMDIGSVLINLTNGIENKNQDEVLSALKILKQQKEHDFTLQVVKHFQLFEKLIYLEKIPNEEIQLNSIAVINLALNLETIQHSMECNIISFLIGVINEDSKSTGFLAIQCLSKIASCNNYSHDKVIFHLASLDILQTSISKTETDYESTDNECIVTEYVEAKPRLGRKRYVPYQAPGILPLEEEIETSISNEKVQSFQNLLGYIQFSENENNFICLPSLNLISSLLKFDLNPSIISFCLETLISLIPISNECTLIIILKALCRLSKQKSILWNESFQNTDPQSWISALFQSDLSQKSVKIVELLMFFVSNVIKQGVTIYGLPFGLLIDKLKYVDEKYIVATYAASSIDSMLKIHNSFINTFIELGLLTVTNNVYSDLSFSAKALMVSYLTRICQFGSARHKKMIIDMNMVSFLVDVLMTDFANEDLLLRIFLALNEIFEYAKNHDFNSCYQQIVDNITAIREFQDHENRSISNIAMKFINKFIDKIDDEYDDDGSSIFNF